jgi:hypothetical protein
MMALRPALTRCRIMLRSNSEERARHLEEQLAGRRGRIEVLLMRALVVSLPRRRHPSSQASTVSLLASEPSHATPRPSTSRRCQIGRARVWKRRSVKVCARRLPSRPGRP